MRLLKTFDVCFQMSYQPRIQALKRKLDETKAYITVSNGLAMKRRAPAAAKAALEAWMCLETTHQELICLCRTD